MGCGGTIAAAALPPGLRVLRTRSAVHIDVMAAVPDNVGLARSFAASTEAWAHVSLKGSSWHHGGGEGAV